MYSKVCVMAQSAGDLGPFSLIPLTLDHGFSPEVISWSKKLLKPQALFSHCRKKRGE